MLGCKGLKSNFQISVEGKPGLLCCLFVFFFITSLCHWSRKLVLQNLNQSRRGRSPFPALWAFWSCFFFFEILLALDGTFLSSVWPLISGFVFTTLNQKAPLYRKLVIFGLRITGNELFFTLQQSISMSEWSNILACGDAAGEVVAVHVLPKKRKTFARFVRMSVKLLDV